MSKYKYGRRSEENVFDQDPYRRQMYGGRYYDNPDYYHTPPDIGLRYPAMGRRSYDNSSSDLDQSDRKRRTSTNKSRIAIIVAIVLLACALIAGIVVAVYFTSIPPPQNKSEVITEVEVSRVKAFQGEVTLAKNWDVSLNDSNSSLYKEQANNFTSAMDAIYKNNPQYNSTVVEGFRNGSIVVEYKMYFIVIVLQKVNNSAKSDNGQQGHVVSEVESNPVDTTKLMKLLEDNLPKQIGINVTRTSNLEEVTTTTAEPTTTTIPAPTNGTTATAEKPATTTITTSTTIQPTTSTTLKSTITTITTTKEPTIITSATPTTPEPTTTTTTTKEPTTTTTTIPPTLPPIITTTTTTTTPKPSTSTTTSTTPEPTTTTRSTSTTPVHTTTTTSTTKEPTTTATTIASTLPLTITTSTTTTTPKPSITTATTSTPEPTTTTRSTSTTPVHTTTTTSTTKEPTTTATTIASTLPSTITTSTTTTTPKPSTTTATSSTPEPTTTTRSTSTTPVHTTTTTSTAKEPTTISTIIAYPVPSTITTSPTTTTPKPSTATTTTTTPQSTTILTTSKPTTNVTPVEPTTRSTTTPPEPTISTTDRPMTTPNSCQISAKRELSVSLAFKGLVWHDQLKNSSSQMFQNYSTMVTEAINDAVSQIPERDAICNIEVIMMMNGSTRVIGKVVVLANSYISAVSVQEFFRNVSNEQLARMQLDAANVKAEEIPPGCDVIHQAECYAMGFTHSQTSFDAQFTSILTYALSSYLTDSCTIEMITFALCDSYYPKCGLSGNSSLLPICRRNCLEIQKFCPTLFKLIRANPCLDGTEECVQMYPAYSLECDFNEDMCGYQNYIQSSVQWRREATPVYMGGYFLFDRGPLPGSDGSTTPTPVQTNGTMSPEKTGTQATATPWRYSTTGLNTMGSTTSTMSNGYILLVNVFGTQKFAYLYSPNFTSAGYNCYLHFSAALAVGYGGSLNTQLYLYNSYGYERTLISESYSGSLWTGWVDQNFYISPGDFYLIVYVSGSNFQAALDNVYLTGCNGSTNTPKPTPSTSLDLEIRLSNQTYNYGRVEIRQRNSGDEWGTICDDMWDELDAKVVCRNLGYPEDIEAYSYRGAFFGQGYGPIWINRVDCSGNESSLSSCMSQRWGNIHCTHIQDAGVSCGQYIPTTARPSPPTYTTLWPNYTTSSPPGGLAVRLVNGSNCITGRVEIWYQGQWGTICDDSWSYTGAQVICRMLGYSTFGAIAFGSATYGQGTGPILLDEVRCNGWESSIADCSHNLWGQHDCSHSEDASVRCGGTEDQCFTQETVNCDFDRSNCGYTMAAVSGSEVWRIQYVQGIPPLPSTSTNNSSIGGNRVAYYININGVETDEAYLKSPAFTMNTSTNILEFYYLMNASTLGALRLEGEGVELWESPVLRSEEENKWMYQCASLNQLMPDIEQTVSFYAKKGPISFRVIAVDSIELSEGTCQYGLKDATCDFERPSVHGYTINCTYCKTKIPKFRWYWGNGSTPSEETGPYVDHTYGTKNGNSHYMYAEASYGEEGDATALTFPIVSTKMTFRAVQFYYNMYGKDIGSLRVMLEYNGQKIVVWEKTGNNGNLWTRACTMLPENSNVTIIFVAVRGPGPFGDIAVDDIELITENCPHPITCMEDFQQCEYTRSSASKKYMWDWNGDIHGDPLGCNFEADDCPYNSSTWQQVESSRISQLGYIILDPVYGEKGHYIYTSAKTYASSYFSSPWFMTETGSSCQLSFMYKCNVNSSYMDFYVSLLGKKYGWYGTLFYRSHYSATDWMTVSINIPIADEAQLTFAVYGRNFEIALDEISSNCGGLGADVEGQMAVLRSPVFQNKHEAQYLIFFHQIPTTDTIKVVFQNHDDGTETVLSSLSSITDSLELVCINLPRVAANTSISFEAIRGDNSIKSSNSTAIRSVEIKDGLCPDTLDVHNCTFESDDALCGRNIISSVAPSCDLPVYMWVRHSGATWTAGTGPDFDHTFSMDDMKLTYGNQTGKGHYMYADASVGNPGDTTTLTLKDFLIGKFCSLQFFYHMYGNSTPVLHVRETRGAVEKVLPSLNLNAWIPSCLELKNDCTVQESTVRSVSFVAERGNGPWGDVAIDDVSLSIEKCPYASINCTFTNGMCGYVAEKGWELNQIADGGYLAVRRGESGKLISPSVRGPGCITLYYTGTNVYSYAFLSIINLTIGNGVYPILMDSQTRMITVPVNTTEPYNLVMQLSAFYSGAFYLHNVTFSSECPLIECQEHDFACKHYCISAANTCDGHTRHCSDGSDEVDNLCPPSIKCDFNKMYACNYTFTNAHLTELSYNMTTGIVDYSVLLNSLLSYVESPVGVFDNMSCLQYKYTQYGEGRHRLVTNTSDFLKNLYIFDGLKAQGIPVTLKASLPSGNYSIIFEFQTVNMTGSYAQIDDVEILTGSCHNYSVSCNLDEEFLCQNLMWNGDILEICLPNANRCNRHVDCKDGSDEMDCPYSLECDFNEHMCGYRNYLMSSVKWRRVATPVNVGGYYLFDRGPLFGSDGSATPTPARSYGTLPDVGTGTQTTGTHWIYSTTRPDTMGSTTSTMSAGYILVVNVSLTQEWAYLYSPNFTSNGYNCSLHFSAALAVGYGGNLYTKVDLYNSYSYDRTLYFQYYYNTSLWTGWVDQEFYISPGDYYLAFYVSGSNFQVALDNVYLSGCNGIIVTGSQVRLVGGQNQYEGRVEVYYNGLWGTICDDYWDNNDAAVVCRMLGYSTIGASAVCCAGFGSNSNLGIFLDDVMCRGNESSIYNCSHNAWYSHNCVHSEDAGVRCGNDSFTSSKVRLVGGQNQYEGRVEVYYNGSWGTICDDSWDDNDAAVVCRMLGYSTVRASAVCCAGFGFNSTLGIFLDNVMCRGNESSIYNCSHNAWYSHDCTHSEDAGVRCGSSTNTSGTTPGGYAPYITSIDARSYGTYANITCIANGYPNPSISYYISAGSRFVDGNITGHTIVGNSMIVNYNYTWSGYYCMARNAFGYYLSYFSKPGIPSLWTSDITSTSVMLHVTQPPINGNLTLISYVIQNFWNSEWRIVVVILANITSYNVTGLTPNSTNIFVVAASNALGYGNYSNQLVVTLGNTVTGSQVRLVGGQNQYEGRVEVYYRGSWGTICDDSWDNNDAAVVCRMLGYSTIGASAVCCAGFGNNTNLGIFLDNVMCRGDESSIYNCSHNGWYSHNCVHSEDAGVRCGNDSFTSSQVRLVGGQNQYEGRVEVYYNGSWGTICDDSWDDNDAAVVCRMLGFSTIGASAVCCAGFGNNTNLSIFLDDVMCRGNESSIYNCSHNPWFSHNCAHSEDAGVRCGLSTNSSGTTPVLSTNTSGTTPGGYAPYITSVDARSYGTYANITCIANGYPNPSISYYISAGSRFVDGNITGHTILGNSMIVNYNYTWSGYYCMARNAFGYYLSYFSKPGKPSLWTSDITSTSVMLHVTQPPNNGNLTLVSYIIQNFWNSEWSIVATILANITSYNVTGLTPNSTNIFVVAASNALGYGNYSNQVVVTLGNTFNGSQVRLVGGQNQYEGRVEIYYNGSWGTICDDSWDNNDAAVVCRMLGFSTIGASTVCCFGFGSSSNLSIFLDDVMCRGNESSIYNCSHNGWYSHDCTHSEDAGVRCAMSSTLAPTTVSLPPSTSMAMSSTLAPTTAPPPPTTAIGNSTWTTRMSATTVSPDFPTFPPPKSITTVAVDTCEMLGYLSCFSGNQCYKGFQRCNGYFDCSDQSDEWNCNKTSTTTMSTPTVMSDNCEMLGYLSCFSGNQCYSGFQQCNGYFDCKDQSDEWDCYTTSTTTSTPTVTGDNCEMLGYLSCFSGNQCYYGFQRCNGYFDCRDQSDEWDCHITSTTTMSTPAVTGDNCEMLGYLSCFSGNQCYYGFQRCNGYFDCRDQSDEWDCHITSTTTMSTPAVTGDNCEMLGYLSCFSGNQCYNGFQRCNGFFDCRDQSDEWNCNSTWTTTMSTTVSPDGCYSNPVSTCLQYGFERVIMPSITGHTSVTEAGNQLMFSINNIWSLLANIPSASTCINPLLTFLCGSYMSDCVMGEQHPLCRESCEAIAKSCVNTNASGIGAVSNVEYLCKFLPYQVDDQSCLPINMSDIQANSTVPDNGSTPMIMGVRLVNGNSEYSGRLEVLVNGIWGTVCNSRYSNDFFAAAAICYELGFSYNGKWIYGIYYGYGSRTLINSIYCPSGARDLDNCTIQFDSYCPYSYYSNMGLVCVPASATCNFRESECGYYGDKWYRTISEENIYLMTTYAQEREVTELMSPRFTAKLLNSVTFTYKISKWISGKYMLSVDDGGNRTLLWQLDGRELEGVFKDCVEVHGFRNIKIQLVFSVIIGQPLDTTRSTAQGVLDVTVNSGSCPGVFPAVACTFESSTACQFEATCNNKNNYRFQMKSGPSDSSNTGPQMNFTTQNNTGHYMIADASYGKEGDSADFKISVTVQPHQYYLRYRYYMSGPNVGNLQVHIVGKNGPTSILVSEHHGDQGESWNTVCWTIPSTSLSMFYIVFNATRGNGTQGDIAIDDIEYNTKPCPHPVSCDFERPNYCDYNFSQTAYHWQGDYLWQQNGTQLASGNFIRTDPYNGSEGDVAEVHTPRFNLGADTKCVSFAFIMSGDVGTLNVYVVYDNDVAHRKLGFSTAGNQGTNWYKANAIIEYANSAYKTAAIVFSAEKGDGTDSVIGLDNIMISSEECIYGIQNKVCNFDDPYLCGIQSNCSDGSQYQWQIYEGASMTDGTGASSDADEDFEGSYLTVDSSYGGLGDVSFAWFPPVHTSSTTKLIFDYLMYGRNEDFSNLTVLFGTQSGLTTLDQLCCNRGNVWSFQCLPLPTNMQGTVYFKATWKNGVFGDISLDNVGLVEGSCPTQSVVCDFDIDDFKCGYRGWQRTLQDTNYFMASTNPNGTSILMAPFAAYDGPACIGFDYKVSLDGFYWSESGLLLNVSFEMTSGEHSENLFVVTKDTGYNWVSGQVQIPDLNNAVGFRIMFAAYGKGYFAVDKVILKRGLCSLPTCATDEFACIEKCIPIALECDKKSDCANGRDERVSCKPSMACDFDTAYHCGYRNTTYNSFNAGWEWVQNMTSRIWNATWNIVDEMNETGSFLVARPTGYYDIVTVQSPTEKFTEIKCLRFSFFGSGVLKVYINDITSSAWSNVAKDEQFSWQTGQFNLPVGDVSVKFRASINQTSSVDSIVGIDHIELLNGSCASNEISCSEFYIRCLDNSMCIALRQLCNRIADCPDGSDESEDYCPATLACQFEDVYMCGYRNLQNNTTWDQRSGNFFKLPQYDHTYGNETGQFMVVYNTSDLRVYYNLLSRYGPGYPYRLEYSNSTLISRRKNFTTKSCVYFYYYLNGTAVRPNPLSAQLFVYVNSSGGKMLAWYDHINRTVSGWLKGWVNVNPGHAEVIFVAKTVTTTTVWPGVVALDDVYVISRPCPAYPDCGHDTFRCTTSRVCIPAYMQCDGSNDCLDGSDEENCISKPNYQLELINGDGSYGSIAIFYQGLWRPVCMSIYSLTAGSDKTVQLACRKMGYTGRYQGAFVNSWQNPVQYAMQVSCSYYNEDISNCTMNLTQASGSTSSCYYYQAAFCSNDECFSGERLCPPDHTSSNYSSSTKCISYQYFCDGIPDCPGATDELNCAKCSTSEFECSNHQCISASQRCDGTPQCGDNSDEYGCVVVANNRSKIYHSHLSAYLPVCYNNMNGTLANILCSLSGQGSSRRYQQYTYVQNGTMLTPRANTTILSLVPGYTVSVEPCYSVLLQCTSIECGATIFDDSRLPKILFGRDAVLGQLPWQIALYANGNFICGGSIIHPNWVLTAAHCTEYLQSYSVIVGAVEVESSSSRSYQGQLYSSSRTYNNPLYNSNYDYDNDNSLLYLSQPIAFNNNVRPICIASSRTVDEMLKAGYNTECYVSGWGNFHGYVNRETWEGSLQMVRVYLYNQEECNQIYYKVYRSYPQNTTVCVDNQNLGSPTCFGDSGGPLICRNKYGRFELLGTLSWGYESCFKDGYPDIYQLTYPHANWIEWTTGLHFSDLNMDIE